VVQFPNGEVKSEVEFYTGLKVSKMAQNQAKTQVIYETGHGELKFVQR